MKTCVVMTTINDPKNLNSILDSLEDEPGYVIIATDKKTPKIETNDKRVFIVDIKQQLAMSKNVLGVPFNCIQRRNFGYLFAIKNLNPDVIITVDDDNFLLNNNWVKDHTNNLGIHKEQSESRVNVIEKLLDVECSLHKECKNVVHRGLPFELIDFSKCQKIEKSELNIGVNAGLWEGDPDINAYDRILHPDVKAYYKNKDEQIILDPKIRMHPFNSQNTAIVKFLFPTLFLIPMFPVFYGYKFGRYDDIWQSYICEKIMVHYNMCVRFGTPYVRQERNNHSVIKDLQEEYPGMIFTSKLIEKLENIKLLLNTPLENMYEIADCFLLSQDEMFKYVGEKMLWWLKELEA